MSNIGYIAIGISLICLGYVLWVLLFWNGPIKKKDSKKLAYLRLNDNFVNKSDNEHTDSGAVLDQINEVESTSKLLEAFKEGSLDDDSNSLTRKKHEKFKVIRNTDSADESAPDPET